MGEHAEIQSGCKHFYAMKGMHLCPELACYLLPNFYWYFYWPVWKAFYIILVFIKTTNKLHCIPMQSHSLCAVPVISGKPVQNSSKANWNTKFWSQ